MLKARMPTRTADPRRAALAVACLAMAVPRGAPAQELDVPYVPTPMRVVSTMLEMAGPTPGDSLYDLGSGDGRIVITAAERYGTPGVGVEIDSSRVATAREKARQTGVEDRVRFVRGDLFEVDLSGATVVTLYLLPGVNKELRPKLLDQLRPGARVVSHDFDMGGWRPDSLVRLPEEDGGRATVYFWKVPAHVAGTWVLTTASGGELRLEVDQKFQEVRVRVASGGGSARSARLSGRSIGFTLEGVRYDGEVSGDRMRGTTADGRRWSARRVSGGDLPLHVWQRDSGYRERSYQSSSATPSSETR